MRYLKGIFDGALLMVMVLALAAFHDPFGTAIAVIKATILGS